MNIFLCYPKCSTCKKAKQYLIDNNIDFKEINIKESAPSKEDINNYVKMSEKDIKAFFNTSGLVYKSLGLKDKIINMTYEEKLDILSSDGMLIKRPILITKDKIYVGFKEKEWFSLIK